MIKQGLKSLASNTPNFNNNAVSVMIADTNLGYASASYDLAKTIRNNSVLTTSQKNDVKSTVNTKPYLNIGQLFDDLDIHTDKILTGELGDETVSGSNDRGTFLEHMQLVDSIQSLVPSLFGNTASAIAKGEDDYFGTLRLSINANMNLIRDNLKSINNASMSADTNYRTACTNLKNFIESTKDDSTDFQQTLNTFASAVATAQNSLDIALANEPFLTMKNTLISNRDIINDQITKEIANLGAIRSYTKSLVEIQSYTSLAENTKLNDLIKQSSGSTAWQDYYSKYNERKAQSNPLFDTTSDSTSDVIVEQVLRVRGLPDVTNSLDLESVRVKLLKDVRISSKISTKDKTTAQLIEDGCRFVGIETQGLDVYNQSRLLLANMNENDIKLIKEELANNQSVNTLT